MTRLRTMLRVAAILGLALLLWSAPALADRRVALVVGNGAYQHADRLANPVTDARNMRDALGKLGFAVTYGENLDGRDLRRAIGRFAGAAEGADVALVYFAGHGATFADTPYVVPVDAQFTSLADMPYELVPVEQLIGELRRARGVRIAILDACRDDAAERDLKRVASRSVGVTRGLGRVRDPDGLIIAYATQILSTAADGDPAGDSPFTAALLRHLPTPGLDVKDMFFTVANEVIAATGGRQRPEISVSMYDPYMLGGAPAVATLMPVAPAPSPPDPAAFSTPSPQASAPGTEPVQRGYKLPEGAALVAQPNKTNNWVSSVAYSPDGRTALSGGEDDTLKLWDIASGALIRTFKGHTNSVTSLAFAPDGRTALSGSYDGTLKLWDISAGTLIRTFWAHADIVESVAFSPDGRTILSGGTDNSLKLWDVVSGALVRTFKGHTNSVTSLAFASGGRTIVSSSSDVTLKFWDVASGTVIRALKHGRYNSFDCIAVAQDGKTALSGSSNGTIELWNVADGTLIRRFKGSDESVNVVAFAPNGGTILSGGDDNLLRLWSIKSGTLVRVFKGHAKEVKAAAFAPDGRSFLSGSQDGTIKLWDVETSSTLATYLSAGSEWLSFTPNGLFVGSSEPSRLVAIKRGAERLPMEEFIKLNRRATLAGN